jgi:GH15 family glucan-1,4-alpha-glucosidase
MADEDRYPPIGDYGVIGDCRTVALVSRTASIDWWCLPRYDGPSVFARILDWERGGSFSLEAPGLRPAGRRYRPATAVLETRLATAEGELEVVDFLAVAGRAGDLGPQPFARQKLVRLVRCTAGSVRLTARCEPRPGFASVQRPRMWPAGPEHAPRQCIAFRASGRTVSLAATRPWTTAGGGAASLEVQLVAGEEIGLVLDHGPGDLTGEGVESDDDDRAPVIHLAQLQEWEDETVAFWQEWSAISRYQGPYREAVERSGITLKLLTYHPSGAIVAAGTTSLPETIGGERNWDYRFTWLRDATFTLYALLTLGHRAESDAFMDWLTRVTGAEADPLVLYRVDGAVAMHERTLAHLEGYRGSRPVRIGNSAAWQRQLDIYGDVLDAAYLDARAGNSVTDEDWLLYCRLAELAAERWDRPDTSLWEVRGGARHFVHSKALCWIALDRARRIAEMTGRAETEHVRLRRWAAEAEKIRRSVMRHGRRSDGAFAQSYGSERVDAAALLFPLMGFVHADAPSARATIRAVERELTDESGLVKRYQEEASIEGVEGDEGAFLICSFWLVDNHALRGDLDLAHRRFRMLTAKANDLGLFSEEWDPEHGLLGNFPQAFTHIALISTAHNLERAARDRMAGAVRREAPAEA